MKNAHFVQRNPEKRKVRRMITREFMKSIRHNCGKVLIRTMPSTEARHEISMLKTIFSKFPKMKNNILMELFDYRGKASQGYNAILNYFSTCRKNYDWYNLLIENVEVFHKDIFDKKGWQPLPDMRPELIWQDLCSGPSEKNVNNFVKNFPLIIGSKVFITFLIDGIREKSWAKGLERKTTAQDIHDYLHTRLNCEYISTPELNFVGIDNFPFEYSSPIKGKDGRMIRRRVAVFGFEVENLLTKNKNSLEYHSDMSKTVNKNTNSNSNVKSPERYAELSKRFSNKQIAIFWKMSAQQVAGYAAAAKRKGLV